MLNNEACVPFDNEMSRRWDGLCSLIQPMFQRSVRATLVHVHTQLMKYAKQIHYM
jgi:hypothetical protein